MRPGAGVLHRRTGAFVHWWRTGCQPVENMTIPELLDMAKKAQGFSTDMALAKALGVSRSAVSAWRNGQKGPDTVQAAALAGYTGIPLARVLGIVGEARAISREEKAVWRKLAATAMTLLLGVGLALPQHAQAATGHEMAAQSIHYAKIWYFSRCCVEVQDWSLPSATEPLFDGTYSVASSTGNSLCSTCLRILRFQPHYGAPY